MIRMLVSIALLVCASQQAGAVGLGEVQQNSSLGQPLHAVIPVTDVGEWNKDQLKIQLSGLSESEARSIKATVKGSGATQAITLTTKDPVSEPHVSFTLQISWPEGSLQRNYQLLLDPPALR